MIVGLGLGITAAGHFVVTAVGEVIRKKVGVTAIGNTQVDTAQSKFGGASALFDGNGDLLNTNFHPLFGTDDFTIEFWMRPSTVDSTFRRIMTSIIDNSANQFVIIRLTNANLLQTYVGSSFAVTGTTTITANNWYHIAIVRNNAGFKVYLNGVLESSSANSGNLSSSAGPIYLGGYYSVTNLEYFAGHIDEVRFSNTARYTANFTPSTTPFVNDENTLLLLHMDGTDASTVFEDDNGVRAKKGMIAVGNAQIDTAQSKFGGSSALFDGSGDYISIPYHPDLRFGTGDFTFECWFRDNGRVQSFPLLMSNINAFATGGWVLHDRHNSYSTKLTFWVYSYNTGAPMLISTTTVSENTWYHIAVVRNGTTWKMYINGTEEASVTSSVNLDSGNTTSASTISGSGGGAFTGHIDEVRWSNTARYTANFTPSTTPFVNDENTLLLIHADGTDGTTFFEDDNGQSPPRIPKHISYYGNAQIDTAQSKFGGSALLCDGTTDYLDTMTTSEFAFGTGQYTIETWLRLASTGKQHSFFDLRAGGNDWVLYVNTSNKLEIYTGAGATETNAMSANVWYHIAVVRDATNIKVYRDGTQVLSTSAVNISGDRRLRIGGGRDGASYPNTDLNGWMDEVRVSNVARYTTGFTPSTTAFVNDDDTLLLLHFNGADASTVFVDDAGQRSKKGITAIGNAQVDTAQSQFGGASALFDGSGDKLEIPYSTDLALGGTEWTVEYWARINTHAGTYTGTVAMWSDASGGDGSVYYFSTNMFNGTQKMGIQYIYGNNSNSGPITFGSSTLSTGVWQHHAFVRNGNTLTAYLDGVSQGTHDMTGRTFDITGLNLSSGNATNLKIGGIVAGGYYNGHLDEIRISNTARYTTGFTPSTTPFQNDSNTLLLLHMDGTDGTTVFTDDNGVTPNWSY